MRKIISLFLVFILFCPSFCYAERNKPPLGSQINWSHPLSKGLVGCWLMNEGGGNKINDIARKNNGTNSGGTWNTTTKGKVLYFNGSSYVNCGSSGSINSISTAISLVAWIKTSSSTNSIQIISHDGVASIPVRCWDLDIYVSKLQANFWDSTGNRSYTDSLTTVNDNVWHFIVATCDAKGDRKARVYIDGKLDNTGTQGNFYDLNTSLTRMVYIGARDYTTACYFTGYISDVCVYNRALSPQEIQQLYIDPYCFIKKPSLIDWFKAVVSGGYTGQVFVVSD